MLQDRSREDETLSQSPSSRWGACKGEHATAATGEQALHGDGTGAPESEHVDAEADTDEEACKRHAPFTRGGNAHKEEPSGNRKWDQRLEDEEDKESLLSCVKKKLCEQAEAENVEETNPEKEVDDGGGHTRAGPFHGDVRDGSERTAVSGREGPGDQPAEAGQVGKRGAETTEASWSAGLQLVILIVNEEK